MAMTRQCYKAARAWADDSRSVEELKAAFLAEAGQTLDAKSLETFLHVFIPVVVKAKEKRLAWMFEKVWWANGGSRWRAKVKAAVLCGFYRRSVLR